MDYSNFMSDLGQCKKAKPTQLWLFHSVLSRYYFNFPVSFANLLVLYEIKGFAVYRKLHLDNQNALAACSQQAISGAKAS